jgi:hypothetical protein
MATLVVMYKNLKDVNAFDMDCGKSVAATFEGEGCFTRKNIDDQKSSSSVSTTLTTNGSA